MLWLPTKRFGEVPRKRGWHRGILPILAFMGKMALALLKKEAVKQATKTGAGGLTSALVSQVGKEADGEEKRNGEEGGEVDKDVSLESAFAKNLKGKQPQFPSEVTGGQQQPLPIQQPSTIPPNIPMTGAVDRGIAGQSTAAPPAIAMRDRIISEIGQGNQPLPQPGTISPSIPTPPSPQLPPGVGTAQTLHGPIQGNLAEEVDPTYSPPEAGGQRLSPMQVISGILKKLGEGTVEGITGQDIFKGEIPEDRPGQKIAQSLGEIPGDILRSKLGIGTTRQEETRQLAVERTKQIKKIAEEGRGSPEWKKEALKVPARLEKMTEDEIKLYFTDLMAKYPNDQLQIQRMFKLYLPETGMDAYLAALQQK